MLAIYDYDVATQSHRPAPFFTMMRLGHVAGTERYPRYENIRNMIVRLILGMLVFAVGTATPRVLPAQAQSLDLPQSTVLSLSSDGAAPRVVPGYGVLRTADASSGLAGLAIFSLRQNETLVSETSILASRPLLSGTVFV